MKIRFIRPATARLEFHAGDELHVAALTPALEALLASARIDGEKVARLVADDETAAVDDAAEEMAVLRRGRARGQRPETVSR